MCTFPCVGTLKRSPDIETDLPYLYLVYSGKPPFLRGVARMDEEAIALRCWTKSKSSFTRIQVRQKAVSFQIIEFSSFGRCSLMHKPLYVWRSLKKNAAAAVAQFWALQIIFCNYNAHHTYLPTYLVKHESTFYHRDHIQTEIALIEIKWRPAGPDPMKHFQCNFILRSFFKNSDWLNF